MGLDILYACNTPLIKIGEEFVRRELVFVPAKLKIVEIYSLNYSCPECSKRDLPIIKKGKNGKVHMLYGMASAGTVAWVMYQKFCNSLPYCRQEKDWKQYGVAITRATIANWVIRNSEAFFRPVYEYFHRKLLERSYFPVSVSWNDAKKYCEDMGGHLVTITSKEEQEIVYNIMDNGSKLFYWIGGTDEKVEGEWKWDTGERWQYSNWCQDPIQPDNQSKYGYIGENYVAMLRLNGQWIDLQDGADPEGDSGLMNAGFICEWSSVDAKYDNVYEVEINNITYRVTGEGAELINCRNQSSKIELPDNIDGVKLIRIGDYSFKGCTNLQYIDIPEGVTELGEYAFTDSTNIIYMVLPNSLESIMDWALNAPNISFICHVNTFAQQYAEKYKRPWSQGDTLP